MTLQNALIILGALALVIVVGGYAGMQLFYGSIYKFDQTATDPDTSGLPGLREVTFTSEDGAEVSAWIRPPQGNLPVILYFMGNFTSIGPSVGRLAPFLEAGYGLAALVYRGSSGKDGAPGEEVFAGDARALYDQLDTLIDAPVPPDRRIAYGYSLGSGVAVRLAAERDVAAVALEAAYARFCDYFTDRYHGLPFCRVMTRERYDSIDRITRINAPLILFHGEKDDAISIASARRLFDAAAEPKEFHAFADGTHVNLGDKGLYPLALAFFAAHVPAAGSAIKQ